MVLEKKICMYLFFTLILPYKGIAPILFKCTEPFEQIVNTHSTEDSMWNLLKIAQAVSEKTFKNYTALYTKLFYYFNYIL